MMVRRWMERKWKGDQERGKVRDRSREGKERKTEERENKIVTSFHFTSLLVMSPDLISLIGHH